MAVDTKHFLSVSSGSNPEKLRMRNKMLLRIFLCIATGDTPSALVPCGLRLVRYTPYAEGVIQLQALRHKG
jgi:hypothetical protein